MTNQHDRDVVVARAVLQAVAQYIANDPALLEHLANLLGDEFREVVRQTIDDLFVNEGERRECD